MSGHCACSASTVIPSGPAAPLFDTTLNNAEPSRSTTSSIVAGTPVRSLTIAFGALAPVLPPDRSGDRLPEPPPGASAVAIGNRSCDTASSTGTAFPSHRRSNPWAGRALPRRPVLHGPPTSAGPSTVVLSFSGLPATPAGTQQISRGKALRFRGDHVATTPLAPTGIGHRCRRPARPPKDAFTALHFRSPPPRIYGFFQTRPHGSPPTQPAADEPPGELRAAPLPHRCWVPPVRAPGQDSHLRSQRHARHTVG